MVSFTVPAQVANPAATNGASPRFQQRLQRPLARPTVGKLLAVDKAARTLTIAQTNTVDTAAPLTMTLHVSTNTLFNKNGKRATLDDGVVGESVRYYSRRGEDGKQVASWVMFGQPPVVGQPKGPVNRK